MKTIFVSNQPEASRAAEAGLACGNGDAVKSPANFFSLCKGLGTLWIALLMLLVTRVDAGFLSLSNPAFDNGTTGWTFSGNVSSSMYGVVGGQAQFTFTYNAGEHAKMEQVINFPADDTYAFRYRRDYLAGNLMAGLTIKIDGVAVAYHPNYSDPWNHVGYVVDNIRVVAGQHTVTFEADDYLTDLGYYFQSILIDDLTISTAYVATNSALTYYGLSITNYPAAPSVTYATGISSSNELTKFPPVQVRFTLTGTNVLYTVSGYDYAGSNMRDAYMDLIVNGVEWTNYPSFYTRLSVASYGNTENTLLLAFTNFGTYDICMNIKGGFGGLWAPPGNTISKYSGPKPNLLIVLGDSYTEGYVPNAANAIGPSSSFWFEGWAWDLTRLNPGLVVAQSAISGTGFVATGGGLNYLQRVVSDVCVLYTNAVNSGNYNRIYITASGTINDRSQTQAQIFSNATNVYTLIKNACPQASLFSLGNWYGGSGSGNPLTVDYPVDIALSNAAVNLGIPYFSPVKDCASILTPTNYNLFFTGTGADAVHPSAPGYAIMASWLNGKLTTSFGTNWNPTAQNGSGTVSYHLTVNSGSGSGDYTNGQPVKIVANSRLGYAFTGWTGSGTTGFADPSLATNTLIMPAMNASITAQYVPVQISTFLNVTNFGAVADAITFPVATTSNSPVVSVIGTNLFSAADIGKVIEVFRTGPWTYYNNNPARGVFSTNQDTICVLTNVTDGTNLWLTIPQGWTTNTVCTLGSNNKLAIQSAIDTASNLVANAVGTNVTIYFPAGKYLVVGDKEFNAGYICQQINDADAALTISIGGLTLLGESTNSVLLGCGAGMEHRLWNNYDPNNTWPYGQSGAFVPVRGTLLQNLGTIRFSHLPLIFQNLTFDGGVQQGEQSYGYWIPHEGNGDGWDTTHHAILDVNPNGTPGDPAAQMHQLKIFTNCVFQHWRGEMVICTTATGGTNTFNEIANCIFYDGNASAINLYYGQRIHDCYFNQLVKVEEYYQENATLPVWFYNNTWTNIGSTALSVVGAVTNFTCQPFVISNNIMYGPPNNNQITLSPAQNVTIISNQLYGSTSVGISFTAAGLQGNSVISNIVIACNQFNDTVAPITMDGYPVTSVMISNNTSSASGTFVSAAGGWKTKIVLAQNSALGCVDGRSIQAGSYFLDTTNNNFGALLWDNGYYANPSYINYAAGRRHVIQNSSTIFILDDSNGGLIPAGAVLNVINNGSGTAKIYRSAKSYNPPIMTGPGTALSPGQSINFNWDGNFWRVGINSIPGTVSVTTNQVASAGP